jgi:hypothetical protein
MVFDNMIFPIITKVYAKTIVYDLVPVQSLDGCYDYEKERINKIKKERINKIDNLFGEDF